MIAELPWAGDTPLHRSAAFSFHLLSHALLFIATGLGFGLALRNSCSSPPSSGTYQHAAVATDAPQCSKVGVDILKKNGTAVDAAIASLLCVGVVNLHSTGIGGGGFMLYYNATSGSATVFDYRETAPLKGGKYMYNGTAEDSTSRGELISYLKKKQFMQWQWMHK